MILSQSIVRVDCDCKSYIILLLKYIHLKICNSFIHMELLTSSSTGSSTGSVFTVTCNFGGVERLKLYIFMNNGVSNSVTLECVFNFSSNSDIFASARFGLPTLLSILRGSSASEDGRRIFLGRPGPRFFCNVCNGDGDLTIRFLIGLLPSADRVVMERVEMTSFEHGFASFCFVSF